MLNSAAAPAGESDAVSGGLHHLLNSLLEGRLRRISTLSYTPAATTTKRSAVRSSKSGGGPKTETP